MERDGVRPDPRPERQRAPVERHAPRLSLLGGFALSCDDRPVPAPKRVRRLLVLLALAPDRVDRERAGDRLWPEASPRQQDRSLTRTLSALHKACPFLVTEQGRQLLLAPDLTVDLHELARLERRLADPADTDPALMDVDLHPFLGELLYGWEDEPALMDWLVPERELFRGLAIDVLAHVALRRTAAGRHTEALRTATLAVCADPLSDTAVRTLIKVHFARGNGVDALRAYRAFRERLRRDVGPHQRPMPETTWLLVEGLGLVRADGESDGDDPLRLLHPVWLTSRNAGPRERQP